MKIDIILVETLTSYNDVGKKYQIRLTTRNKLKTYRKSSLSPPRAYLFQVCLRGA